jgi:Zn-dependent peptidase ImmA (M78 family)
MTDTDDEVWEKLANAWREAAGQSGSARLNPIGFVRWLKQTGVIKDYVRVPDGALPTAKGEYNPDEGIIYYRESTWSGAEHQDPHDEWSLIHETTHAILKHKEIRYRALATARNYLSSSTNRDEAHANRLTASLIAPFDKADFKPGTTVNDLRRRFNLSHEAAKRRLEEFERIYRRRNGIRRPLPPGVVDFLEEQRRKGYKVTSLDGLGQLGPEPAKRYEGDPCPVCQKFRLLRNGIGVHCDNCGTRPGED